MPLAGLHYNIIPNSKFFAMEVVLLDYRTSQPRTSRSLLFRKKESLHLVLCEMVLHSHLVLLVLELCWVKSLSGSKSHDKVILDLDLTLLESLLF